MEEVVRFKSGREYDFGGFFSVADRGIWLRFPVHRYGVIIGMNTMIMFAVKTYSLDKRLKSVEELNYFTKKSPFLSAGNIF